MKKKNRKCIKGEILSSGVCWHCQETISSKSTKRCWSLGECLEWLNTRCWETCCVGQHVTSSRKPTQLCFCLVYARHGTLGSTKTEPISWKYWTFQYVVNKYCSKNSFLADRLLFGWFIISRPKSPSLQMLWGRIQKVLWVKLTGFLILLVDSQKLDLFTAFPYSCL